jgi:rhodanese-related sulfurtransferase
MDLKISSTIGFERGHNELLSVTGEDDFVERATSRLAPQPPNFQRIVEMNRGALRSDVVEPRPLAPRQVHEHQQRGALVVDVRTELQFDEAHIPGAVSITALRAGFGSKLAWVVEPEQEIVFAGRDDEEARRAAALSGSVGIVAVTGFLSGGMTSWREEGLPTERTERVGVEELHERWEASGRSLQLLDVRERHEFDAEHIPGSVNVPYHDVHDVPESMSASEPIAVLCSSGQRASVAASLLRRSGASDVWHVVPGGVPHWSRSGWPVEAA